MFQFCPRSGRDPGRKLRQRIRDSTLLDMFRYSSVSVYRRQRSQKALTTASCAAPHKLKRAHCQTSEQSRPGEHVRLGRRLVGLAANKRGGHNEAFRVAGAATASRPSAVNLSMHAREPLVSCERCAISSIARRKIFRVSLLRGAIRKHIVIS